MTIRRAACSCGQLNLTLRVNHGASPCAIAWSASAAPARSNSSLKCNMRRLKGYRVAAFGGPLPRGFVSWTVVALIVVAILLHFFGPAELRRTN